VPTFAGNRVEEVNATKGTRDDRVDVLASALDPQLRSAANVREDVSLAQLDQSKLGVVAVGKEV
jgi:hypothetical protein